MIYLDNAATTKICDSVIEAMMPFLRESYGNPSSVYSLGREAEIAVSNARRTAADCLGCRQKEIFFTSGGTESNNWAIKSAARMQAESGRRHIITSSIEHHSVLNVLAELEKEGFSVTCLPVYENGLVRAEDFEGAVREDTGLATIMYVNNEIGTIQPVKQIGEICRARGILFHTDAVQGAGNVKIDIAKQNIDLLSLSAHKLHGPKGAGLMYCSEKLAIKPFIHGGGQERGVRAGTENVAGIVGMAKALEEAEAALERKNAVLKPLQDRLAEEIGKIEGSKLNGDRHRRIAGNVNFSFDGIESEALLLQLDLHGICAGSGAACAGGALEPSHVLTALGLSRRAAGSGLRISMSRFTTAAEVDRLLAVLPRIVEKLRALSSQ